jgi:pimeloyl-ACP methyl ester carboxylesterase
MSASAVTEFRVELDPVAVDDLRARLRHTRWPERETVDDWSQGLPLAYAQELCSYWAERYDYTAAEQRFNAFPQFRTELSGDGPEPLPIHFVHVRSPHDHALPLVMTHGWPGSVVEFHKVIGPLSDPTAYGGDARDAFHVVCPSLPGYGFSGKPTRTGWNIERIARAWIELMARLGYSRYGAQGGDWGAFVTTSIGQQDPDHLAGVHVQLPTVQLQPAMLENLTEAEQGSLESGAYYGRWGSGYSTQQSSRPQTLGYGLLDSPAGQCTWVVEKFWDWTDCDGHPENVLSRDDLLDNVMYYWIPGNAASSARLYWESFHALNTDPVTVPSGCSIFPKEIFRPSRRWVETRFTDLRYYNAPPKGGHFAAFEQPQSFVDEVRAFFRLVR